jgi:hypothetical protein
MRSTGTIPAEGTVCGFGSLRRLPVSNHRVLAAGNLRALGPRRRAGDKGLVGTYRRLETRRVILGGISR